MKSRQSTHIPTPSAQQQHEQGKITLEELLQLKRAEHPAQEFWAQFETQLKQRQLAAAIEEKRPWWRVFPALSIGIPAGATAAIAIGLVIWNNATTPTPQQVTSTPPIAPTPAKAITQPQMDQTATDAIIALARATAQAIQEKHAATEPQTNTQQHMAAISALHPAAATTNENLAQTARNIFANTTTATAATNYRTQTLGTAALVGSRTPTSQTSSTAALFAMPVALVSDLPALAQIAANNDTTAQTNTTTQTTAATSARTNEETEAAGNEATTTRRERLLTYVDTLSTPATAEDNPRAVRVRDRAASRLNDKALSDSISRFGATGDSLTIKF